MNRLVRGGAALLGLTLFTLCRAAGPPAVGEGEVISPPANAVLPAGWVDVIYRGGQAGLDLDGRPRGWGPYAGPVRAARVRLTPGRHELTVAGRSVVLWGEGPPSPPAFRATRVHPIAPGATGCAACHQTTQADGLTAVGAAKPTASCLECHPPDQFELKHSHPLDPLRNCTSCHAVHGAAHKGLLRAPAKKLCASCHDA